MSSHKEHDFLIQRWWYTPHGVKMAAIATLSALILLPAIMMLVVNCQEASLARIFPDGNRTIIVYAEGGDARHAPPNTLAAFSHALNHTRWIKTDVFRTTDTSHTYIIQSKHHLFITRDGFLRDERCMLTVSQLQNASSTPLLTLNETLAFAAARGAVVLIEFHPCEGDNVTDAIAGMEAIARATPGLNTTQTQYMYADKLDIEPLLTAPGATITRDRVMLRQQIFRSIWDPFDPDDYIEDGGTRPPAKSQMQANVPIAVELFSYDVWTCAKHARVYNETWIHLTNVGPNIVRALKFSAARSIQSPDPQTVIRVARDNDIAVTQ